MILHVRDESTDALVRKLADHWGVNLTEAIRGAVQLALAQEEKKLSLWERTADLRTKFQSFPLTGNSADKAFFDRLSGHEE